MKIDVKLNGSSVPSIFAIFGGLLMIMGVISGSSIGIGLLLILSATGLFVLPIVVEN